MNKFLKIGLILTSVLSIFILILLLLYLYGLPKLVSNTEFIDFIQKEVKKSTEAELILDNLSLKTTPKLVIDFKAKNIMLSKNGEMLLNIENFDINLTLKKLIIKQIIINKLGADDIYIDINQLQKLVLKDSDKKQTKSDFRVKLANSTLYLKKCIVLYRPKSDVLIKLFARDLEITKDREPKYVHFSVLTDIEFNNERFRLMFKDFDTIYFKNRKLHIDNFNFIVDKSMVKVNGFIDEKNNYDIDISSDKFNVKNIKSALDSNLIIPNGREVLACFKDLDGNFNFNIKFSKNNLYGKINIDKITSKLIPLANIPFAITGGNIELDSNNIQIKDIKGYYGSKISNKIEMYGDVKNYTKTADTTIILSGDAENELAKYVSKIAGFNLALKGLSKFAFKIDYDISGNVRVSGGAKVPKGSDMLIENSPISPSKFDRAVGIKLNMLGNDLKIEHINYYISDIISEKGGPGSKPLITVSSHLNMANGDIHELEFDIPNPLPSEFFNVLVNQRIFRNGTFSGKLKYINTDKKHPYIDSDVTLKDVRVVGQGLSVKNGTVTTTANNLVHVNADGRFRRTNYKFDCDIQNRILFPVIVKNIDITLDELDVEKVMQTFAPRPQLTAEQREQIRQRMAQNQAAKSDVPLKYFEIEDNTVTKNTENSSEENAQIVFQPNLIAIKSCNFNVDKGKYKDINFGDLHANLTLTESGILEIKSNKFDFADGISTLKVYCDMLKQKYSVRLGAKDVNSDTIASSILNLSREISGKASALLEFNTDENMKLNGRIQFEIKNGSITKLGLVQYILNMASLFRNPVAMISPSTLFDLVNVPDGSFKNIHGDMQIKDNIIERMMIKSSSPQLSAFIIGRINLENFDSSLRIYTKFSNKNKGLTGFLRGFSLNSLSKKTKFTTEEVSYYAPELSMLPKLETGEENAQVFLTKVDGDLQTANFISSLKKIK